MASVSCWHCTIDSCTPRTFRSSRSTNSLSRATADEAAEAEEGTSEKSAAEAKVGVDGEKCEEEGDVALSTSE